MTDPDRLAAHRPFTEAEVEMLRGIVAHDAEHGVPTPSDIVLRLLATLDAVRAFHRLDREGQH